jgi:hypothetical protein
MVVWRIFALPTRRDTLTIRVGKGGPHVGASIEAAGSPLPTLRLLMINFRDAAALAAPAFLTKQNAQRDDSGRS